jgi:glycosyltransferase involved in cell wall biosynthesis
MMPGTSTPDVAFVLPDLRVGGAERVNLTLANAFAARGLKVDLVMLGMGGALVNEVRPDVRLKPLKAPRFRDSFLPFCGYLSESRPRAMLASMPPLTAIAVAARTLTGAPTRVVIAEHFDWSAARFTPPDATQIGFKVQMWVAYHGSDARVAVSEGVARTAARIANIDQSKIDVVFNPITPLPRAGAPDPAILKAWLDRPGRKLIAVGMLKPQKDYPTLFRAIALLRKTTPVSVLVLGEGFLRPDLEKLRSELGLDDCISMPGIVPDTQPYLNEADLFVLSSVGEGLANVLIEALACGVPVVSTDCPSGPREILQAGQWGSLAPVQDPEGLAGAILGALERSHDREALVRRSLDFSVEESVEKYLALLLPKEYRRPAETRSFAGADA